MLTNNRHMQDCFRKYPEIYGAELAEDEQDGENAGPDNQQRPGHVEGVPEGVAASESQPADVAAAHSESTPAKTTSTAKSDATAENSAPAPAAAPATPAEVPKDDIVQAESSYFDATAEQEPVEAADDSHVPKAAFDATGANKN